MRVWILLTVILSAAAAAGFGFFLMTRLDRLIDGNGKAIRDESETEPPYCVMLTQDMTDEEIAAEIRKFRESHSSSRVVLYGGTGAGDAIPPRSDDRV